MNTFKSTPAAKPYLLLGACVLLYLGATIFQGVNWTDEGYHYTLANLLFSNFHGADPQFGIVHWLSVLLGGWWMKIVPGSMLWARLEWALLWAVAACCALSLARRLDRGWLSLLLVLAAVAMATFHNPACVEYNLLAATIVCALGSLYASILDQRTGRLWRYLLAGAVLALCVPAKVTLAPLVAVFFGFLLLARCPWPALAACAASFVAVSCVLFGVLAGYGALDNYLATIGLFAGNKGPGDHHGLSNLLKIYFDTLLYAATYGFALLASSHMAARIASPRLRPLLAAAACAAVVLAQVVAMKNLSFTIVGVFGFILLLTLDLAAKDDKREFKLLALLTVLSAGSVAGSNFPAHVIKYMLPALLPVSCLLLLRFLRRDEKLLRTQITGLAVGLLLASVAFRLTNPYLDLRQRWLLTTPVATPVTSMIATSAPKARAMGELYNQSKALLKPGEPVIAFPDLPLAHYVLGHPPALQTPWIEAMDKKRIEKRLSALGPGMQQPLPPVLQAAFDPQTRNWGPKNYAAPQFAHTYEAMFAFLKQHGYRQAWSSDTFVIYLPPGR